MPAFDGEGAAQTLQAAKQKGLITALDTAYNDRIEDWFALMQPCFPHLDYFLPSIEEAEAISGQSTPEDMAKFFMDQGCGVAGIKCGGEGSYLLTEDGGQHFPVYKVDPVDTSGAGDSWVAGFLCGLLKELPLDDCALLGNATAAHCIQAVGCTAGVKSLEEIQAFQRSNE